MKKRILTVCLACIVAISMAACSGKNKNDDTSSSTETSSQAESNKLKPSVNYYASSSDKSVLFELKDKKFTITDKNDPDNKIEGTLDDNGDLKYSDKTIEYVIEDKTLKFEINGKKFELSFVTQSEYNTARKPTDSSNAESTAEPTTSEPDTSKPDEKDTPSTAKDSNDKSSYYHMDKTNSLLPIVDTSGDKWTQTPDGWLDNIPNETTRNYFDRDRWKSYTGEGDPNFPSGDPKVEYAFLGTDCEYLVWHRNDGTPYTYEDMSVMLNWQAHQDIYGEEWAKEINENKELYDHMMNISAYKRFTEENISFYTQADSGNDPLDYTINFEAHIYGDDNVIKDFWAAMPAKDVAESYGRQWMYTYSNDKFEAYWTVYPYTLGNLGTIINIRIVDKVNNKTYDRICTDF